MADGPLPIKVTINVTAGNEKPTSDTTEFSVPAMCITLAVVPADGQVDVLVVPEMDPDNFKFLLIRPTLLGKAPIKPADLVEPDGKTALLEYGVPDGGAAGPGQQGQAEPGGAQPKSLRGTHVFVSGQTEWITDILGQGRLTKLRFWNYKPQATQADLDKLPPAERDKVLKKDGKELPEKEKAEAIKKWTEEYHAITVQILAGYSPLSPPAAEKKKSAEDMQTTQDYAR